jgi:dTDP-4-dehydrorhamnose reductase
MAGIPLVTFSSDLVFDGQAGRAYGEEDEVGPACVYGRSKAEAERAVIAIHDRALIVRTSAFFGAWDRYNFAWHVLERLGEGKFFEACPKTIVSPTFVPDLCHAVLDLLIDGETGIWHLANQGEVSWYEFARRTAEGAGHDPERIVAAARPDATNTALTSSRGRLLRPLDQAIGAYLNDLERHRSAFAIAAE